MKEGLFTLIVILMLNIVVLAPYIYLKIKGRNTNMNNSIKKDFKNSKTEDNKQREMVASMAMCAVMLTQSSDPKDKELIVSTAIEFADELIKQLNKE